MALTGQERSFRHVRNRVGWLPDQCYRRSEQPLTGLQGRRKYLLCRYLVLEAR
jgi:hypothetical protein